MHVIQLSATNVRDTDGAYDIGSNPLEYRNIYARKLYGLLQQQLKQSAMVQLAVQ